MGKDGKNDETVGGLIKDHLDHDGLFLETVSLENLWRLRLLLINFVNFTGTKLADHERCGSCGKIFPITDDRCPACGKRSPYMSR